MEDRSLDDGLVALHVGVIARDPEALIAFEQSMRPRVMGWLRSKRVQDADADAIWNEAFLAVVDKAAGVKPLGGPLARYTMTVAHHLWVSRVRDAVRRDEVALEAVADVVVTKGGRGTELDLSQVERIDQCLGAARPTYRAVLEFESRGLATSEIGTILGKSDANVQKLRQRKRAWFRRCLGGIFDA